MALLPNTGFYGFLASCKNNLNTLEEWFVSGKTGIGKGWKLWKGTGLLQGRYTLETDRVALRDRICSTDYDPQTDRDTRKGYLIETNYGTDPDTGEPTAYSYAEFDEIFVRKRGVFRNVEVEKLTTLAGGLLLSAAHGKVAAVYETMDLYYLILEDRVGNDESYFLRGDMALCQRAGFLNNDTDFVQKRYWRLVRESGFTQKLPQAVPEELRQDFQALGKRYVALCKTVCEPLSDLPSQGDVIFLYGHIGDLSLSEVTDSEELFHRRRAVMLSQLTGTKGAFTEYQNIGAEAPYFELDADKIEVTRICGGGRNKFTGRFSLTTEGGIITSETFVKDMDQFPQAIADLLHSEDLKEKILNETEKEALQTDLFSLKKMELRIASEYKKIFEHPWVKPDTELYKTKAIVYFSGYQQLKETLLELQAVLSAPDIEVRTVKELYEVFLLRYEIYRQRYVAVENAIRGLEKEEYRETISAYETKWNEISFTIDSFMDGVRQAGAYLHQTSDRINVGVENRLNELNQEYSRAGLAIGFDAVSTQSYATLDADKVRIKSGTGPDAEEISLLECMPDSIVATVKNEFKEAGMELVAPDQEGAESHIVFYAEKVKIFNENGVDLFPASVLTLTPDEIRQKVTGKYSEAGLEITGNAQKRIRLNADQIQVVHQQKDENGKESVQRVALFSDGKLNTKLLETKNLFTKGFGELTQPLPAGNRIVLDMEKGFNFVGNPGKSYDQEIQLPSGKEYNGVRSTLINTGHADSGDRSLIVHTFSEQWEKLSTLHTTQDLRLLVPPDRQEHPECIIEQVRITPGGMLHLYAYWDETALSGKGELKWLIENLSEYTVENFMKPYVTLVHTRNSLKLLPPVRIGLTYSRSDKWQFISDYYDLKFNDNGTSRSVIFTFEKKTNAPIGSSFPKEVGNIFSKHTNYIVNVLPAYGTEAYLMEQNSESFSVYVWMGTKQTCSFSIEHYEYGF